MAQPAAPLDLNGVNTGFGVWNNGGTATPAWPRMLAAAIVGTETTVSGALSVGGMVAHDGADVATIGPLKIGGYAKAAAPANVSADVDIVNGWFLLNGAQATVLTAAGALIGGDATRGLDVNLRPHTSGGLTTAMFSGSDGSSILVATAQVVKASAGQLYGYYAYNPEAAVTFVHFYNTAAASVTVGTTNPLFTIALPAGAGANVTFPHGVTFSNAGWSVAATTTAGGNTAPATGASLVAWYL